MKFTRLSLTGFKSFCDATDLHLEAGLSGVVGPNGCGKSNLVEALRWVMGESSYKAMRASGMDDVIFSGSGNRPGRNSAEVTLVLDNSDRTAPAPLNTADVLEVTRRIEREAGSVYRINGREVRARDVQLLFADASTGAHSPALVRQGQIGELIAAKPTQRRALLEEAAGISGLHSRRHEAELRLRAAEQNLLRVDDVIAQIEQQLEALKRQARLAVRYRALSGDIRKAEAALFHVRWVKARVAEKEAEAEQGRLTRQLADATHVELEAQKVLFLARQAVQPRREAEVAAAATKQRLVILIEQAEAERKREAGRLAELQRRLEQAEADSRRETELVAESTEALARYASESAALIAQRDGAIGALAEAQAASAAAARSVAEAEAAAREASEALAAIRARRGQAARALAEAESRQARLAREAQEASDALEAIEKRLAADHGVAARQAALDSARQAAEAAEAETLRAEEAARLAQQGVDRSRPPLQKLDTALKGLETERTTLDRILKAAAGGGKWTGIVESLTVAPGHEQALGAALGDDLDMPTDPRAPIHWGEARPAESDPALPDGATPLSLMVTGADALRRRLDQIGLVDDAQAERLAALLRPGQMLVTKAGATWRWDGLRAAADAPSAAAQRLAQRNRLADLDAEIKTMWHERVAAAETASAAAADLSAAREEEARLREGWRRAQKAIAAAQANLDAAQKATGALATRQGTLAEAARQLAAA
ncbi:MAG: chromosome segregation SMC family protein, partial [Devosia sp.]